MFFILKKNYVSIAMTGGRGQIRLKRSQLKMSQLGLRGGRVKLIETMSQNLQFFFFEGFPNHSSSYLFGVGNPEKRSQEFLWSIFNFKNILYLCILKYNKNHLVFLDLSSVQQDSAE